MFSCTNEIKNSNSSFKIISPKESWIYNTNENIIFSIDSNIQNINWNSDIDGFLGTGPTITKNLSCGNHLISATLAHEYTHAINFSNKTWTHLLNSNSKSDVMETFLDEGLSHLTESLCGFGISGGNVIFINYYLKN